MIVGSSIMIYMQITSEMSVDETSNTVKKIILNFLQVISLAAGLPLQWPPVTDEPPLFSTLTLSKCIEALLQSPNTPLSFDLHRVRFVTSTSSSFFPPICKPPMTIQCARLSVD